MANDLRNLVRIHDESEREFAKWRWMMRASGVVHILQFLILLAVVS